MHKCDGILKKMRSGTRPIHCKQRLISRDVYGSTFDAMVAADMDSGLYREVNDCLEQIRQAASMAGKRGLKIAVLADP
jgi:hypothetical protein